jgi:hypothetical protein
MTLPSYVSSLTMTAVPCATRFGLYLRLRVRYECRKPAFGVDLRRKAAATPKVFCNVTNCNMRQPPHVGAEKNGERPSV